MPGPRILVVEDDQNICFVLTEHLNAAGFSVICASTDHEAHEILRQSRDIACLVADVDLGSGTTGFDVSRFARQLDPGIPVIYLSGVSTERSFVAYGVPGSVYYMKPFDGAEIVNAIQRMIAENPRR